MEDEGEEGGTSRGVDGWANDGGGRGEAVEDEDGQAEKKCVGRIRASRPPCYRRAEGREGGVRERMSSWLSFPSFSSQLRKMDCPPTSYLFPLVAPSLSYLQSRLTLSPPAASRNCHATTRLRSSTILPTSAAATLHAQAGAPPSLPSGPSSGRLGPMCVVVVRGQGWDEMRGGCMSEWVGVDRACLGEPSS